MEQVTGDMLTGSGIAGLLALAVLALLRGWVVTRTAHEELRADRDAWRRAAEASQATVDAQSGQLAELLGLTREVVAWQRAH